ncbi:MAG TPA: CRISPR-associated endonuclease Cas1 [Deltaproteobacteria bacterium]|nr:CRISPR-associated endonuclease Cas1 [Deltaproteobacteria bacterium]
MVVYIRTQGARIIKEGRHLLVKKGDATYHTLFTYKLRQIVIYGNVDITHFAFVQLMRNNIDVVFLSYDGRYLGRIAAAEAKNVFLHKRQYLLLDDPAFGLRMSRCIVAGKLSNMATLLMRIKRSKNKGKAGDNARQIQNLMELLQSAESIESVRGYEGRGTALFFEAFPLGFVDNMGFTRRVRRPPTDPVNSVLSLLYTFLMNRVYAAVRIAGLDPYPGFLHSIDYGRYSLVLDLMEEFRSVIAETLTLSLFNLKILQKADFVIESPDSRGAVPMGDHELPDVSKDPIGLISGNEGEASVFDVPEQRMEDQTPISSPSTGKYPVKLRPDAFRKVIDAFEKKLTTAFFYPPAGRRLTYSDAIIYQAGHFRKVIEGEADTYLPVTLK